MLKNFLVGVFSFLVSVGVFAENVQEQQQDEAFMQCLRDSGFKDFTGIPASVRDTCLLRAKIPDSGQMVRDLALKNFKDCLNTKITLMDDSAFSISEVTKVFIGLCKDSWLPVAKSFWSPSFMKEYMADNPERFAWDIASSQVMIDRAVKKAILQSAINDAKK